MDKLILIDTNLYIDDAKIIYKLNREYNKILIPRMVLKELDKFKFDPDLSYSARTAIQTIRDFRSQKPECIIFDLDRYDEFKDPDDKILASAKKYQADIATKDILMSILVEAAGLKSILHDIILNNIFKPYIYLTADSLYEASGEDVFSYQSKYENEGYIKMMSILSKAAGKQLSSEAWWFIIINVMEENPIVYAHNPMLYRIERIDDKPKYREIKIQNCEPIKGCEPIKAVDHFQICAIYALENAPHCLITGRWGSGKSLLACAHTLSKSKNKAFITRAPRGINSKYDVGWLPGPASDKMMDWLQGFTSSLYYIYGNTRNSLDKEGQTYDFVKEELFHKKFQILLMNSIQGLSLLDNDVLIVDEAQLIDVSYMSMILSRPSGTGKLILLGDLNQTYGVVKPSESGLLKLLRALPHKYMAYVELQNSYRSPLLELADKLQDVTINV